MYMQILQFLTFTKCSLILYFFILCSVQASESNMGCQDTSQKCWCNTNDAGLHIDCRDLNKYELKNTLENIKDVDTLSIINLNDQNDYLESNFISTNTCIHNIQISETNIKDLSNEAFGKYNDCIEKITLASNQLVTIPKKAFHNIKHLKEINTVSNKIINIPSHSFYGLKLKKLDLTGNLINKITEAAFAGLEGSLSELDISENNLTLFPADSLHNLYQLQILKLAWNSISLISHIEDFKLKLLHNLDLSFNSFEYLSDKSLYSFPSLKYLSFHYNFITNIDLNTFSFLENLENIILSNNRLKYLHSRTFRNNKKLKCIHLEYNHLHDVNGIFTNLPSLSEIYLTRNNILEVPRDSFLNSNNIKILYLDNNSISSLYHDAFHYLIELIDLNLAFNILDEIPAFLFSSNSVLQILRIDNNKLVFFNNETFKALVNLKNLNLNNNKLSYISKDMFSNNVLVEEINLGSNKINNIDFGALEKLENLKYLYLENNLLRELRNILPIKLTNTQKIKLSHNKLVKINSVVGQNRLLELNMEYNEIKLLSKSELVDLTSLVKFVLSNNLIMIIEDNTFRNLQNVRHLDLSMNLIQNITLLSFYGLTEIEELILSHNKISFIQDFTFNTLKKLRIINLSFNPLKKLTNNMFQLNLPISTLHIDNCEIGYIESDTFRDLNNLKFLSLKNNSLNSSDILTIKVPGLRFLYLSFNSIIVKEFKLFSNFPLIEVLVLEHCNIDVIDNETFIENKKLVKLNLGQNVIKQISKSFLHSSNHLTNLDISNNFLEKLQHYSIHNLKYLETFDASDNLLTKFETNIFLKIANLVLINLSKNEIKQIFVLEKERHPSIRVIDLSFNYIDRLPKYFLEAFPNLRNLNISYNNIFQLKFSSLVVQSPYFFNVDISKNPIIYWTTTLSFALKLDELHITMTNLTIVENQLLDLYANLRRLYLEKNEIRKLAHSPFMKLSLLENLDLSFNRLHQLKTTYFFGLSKLRSLCLSNNIIESIEPFPEDLIELKLLDLSYNKIQNILNEDLGNLKELNVLYLSNNNIKYISATAMRNLNMLTHIDFSNNRIQNLSTKLLNSIENFVIDINLTGNKLICNCEKDNSWTWIQDHPKIINFSSLVCMNGQSVAKCDIASIVQIFAEKYKDNSVLISWFIKNNSVISTLELVYFRNGKDFQVQSTLLDRNDLSVRINNLVPNSNYTFCIVFEPDSLSENSLFRENIERSAKTTKEILQKRIESHYSECISIDTNKRIKTEHTISEKSFNIEAVLNRRMGMIIGCSLGFVVFTIMASILLITKFKRRKMIPRSDSVWGEMNDYKYGNSKDGIMENIDCSSTDNILDRC